MKLQDEIETWHQRTYPNAGLVEVALKLAEEAGEVGGAVLKYGEGRKTMNDIRDEVGDVGIVLLRLCSLLGSDFVGLVTERFENDVRVR